MEGWFFVTVAALLFCFFYVVASTHKRHYYGPDGRLYQALHIRLPGFATIFYPEQIEELSKWVGTRHDKLVGMVDGRENPEKTAGLALQAKGMFTGYVFEQRADGHWVLHRPSRTERYFTMSAFYQVWFGHPAGPVATTR